MNNLNVWILYNDNIYELYLCSGVRTPGKDWQAYFILVEKEKKKRENKGEHNKVNICIVHASLLFKNMQTKISGKAQMITGSKI